MPSELAREIAELRYPHVWTNANGNWLYSEEGRYIGKLIPEPDTNPADCMELMNYLLSFRGISRGESMQEIGAVRLEIYNDAKILVEWHIWRGVGGWAEGDTLELAIATACRDALRAIK